MPPDYNHYEIQKLLVENQRLLQENNQLLKQMRRSTLIGYVFRLVWFILMLGIPAYLYYTLIAPNIDTIKEKAGTLEQMSAEAQKLKEWYGNSTTNTTSP